MRDPGFQLLNDAVRIDEAIRGGRMINETAALTSGNGRANITYLKAH